MPTIMPVPPPPAGFERGFHLGTCEHALSNISRRRLKIARFAETNDPFELFALNCFEFRNHRRALRTFKTRTDAEFGLLCFSRQWKKPVLWSHYADGHRGICLGFDVRSSLGLGGVQPIEYRPDKLRLIPDDRNPDDIPEDVKQRLHVTKSDDWKYEEEIRAIVPLEDAVQDGGLYFWPFGPDLRLVAIVLGERCSLEVESVRALARQTCDGAWVLRGKLGIKYFEVKEDNRFPAAK